MVFFNTFMIVLSRQLLKLPSRQTQFMVILFFFNSSIGYSFNSLLQFVLFWDEAWYFSAIYYNTPCFCCTVFLEILTISICVGFGFRNLLEVLCKLTILFVQALGDIFYDLCSISGLIRTVPGLQSQPLKWEIICVLILSA